MGRHLKRVLVGVVLMAVAGLTGIIVAQEHPAEPHRHPEGQALENPFEANPSSIATGRKFYVFNCRQCHGNQGKGDGDMAHAGGGPSDFTDAVWQHGGSDGEAFLVIKNGVTADMQPYREQLGDEDIWHLVNYLKSLGP